MSDILKKYSIVIGADTKDLFKQLEKVENELDKRMMGTDFAAGVKKDFDEVKKQIEILKSNLSAAKEEINTGISKINTDYMKGEFKSLKDSITREISDISISMLNLQNAINTLNDSAGLNNLSSSINKTLESVNKNTSAIIEKFSEFQGIFDQNGVIMKIDKVNKVVDDSQKSLLKGIKANQKKAVQLYNQAASSLDKLEKYQNKKQVFEDPKKNVTIKTLESWRGEILDVVNTLKLLPEEMQEVNDIPLDAFERKISFINNIIKDMREKLAAKTGSPNDVVLRWRTEWDADSTIDKMKQKIDEYHNAVQKHTEKKPIKFKVELPKESDSDSLLKLVKSEIKTTNEFLNTPESPKLKVGIEIDKSYKQEVEKLSEQLQSQTQNALVHGDVNAKITGGTLTVDSGELAKDSTLNEIKDIISNWDINGTPGASKKQEVHEEKKAEAFINNSTGVHLRRARVDGIANASDIEIAEFNKQNEQERQWLLEQMELIKKLRKVGVKRISNNLDILKTSDLFTATTDDGKYAKYSLRHDGKNYTIQEWQQKLLDAITKNDTDFFKNLYKEVEKRYKYVKGQGNANGIEYDDNEKILARGQIAFGKNEVLRSVYADVAAIRKQTLEGSIDENGVVKGSLVLENEKLEILKKKRFLMQQIVAISNEDASDSRLIDLQNQLKEVNSLLIDGKEYNRILADEKKELDSINDSRKDLQLQMSQNKSRKSDNEDNYKYGKITKEQYEANKKNFNQNELIFEERLNELNEKENALIRNSIKNIISEEENLHNKMLSGDLSKPEMDRLTEVRRILSQKMATNNEDLIEYSNNNLDVIDSQIESQNQVIAEIKNAYRKNSTQAVKNKSLNIVNDDEYNTVLKELQQERHEFSVLESAATRYDGNIIKDTSLLLQTEKQRYDTLYNSIKKKEEELRLYRELKDLSKDITGDTATSLPSISEHGDVGDTYQGVISYINSFGAGTERRNLGVMNESQLREVVQKLIGIAGSTTTSRLNAAISSISEKQDDYTKEDIKKINDLISAIDVNKEDNIDGLNSIVNSIDNVLKNTSSQYATDLNDSKLLLQNVIDKIKNRIPIDYKKQANAKINERIGLLESFVRTLDNKIKQSKEEAAKDGRVANVDYYENQKANALKDIEALRLAKNYSSVESSILTKIKEENNLTDEQFETLKQILDLSIEIEKSNNRINKIEERANIKMSKKDQEKYDQLKALRDSGIKTNTKQYENEFKANEARIAELYKQKENIENNGLNDYTWLKEEREALKHQQETLKQYKVENEEFREKIAQIQQGREAYRLRLVEEKKNNKDLNIGRLLVAYDKQYEEEIAEYGRKIKNNNAKIGKQQEYIRRTTQTIRNNAGFDLTSTDEQSLVKIEEEIATLEKNNREIYNKFLNSLNATNANIENEMSQIEAKYATRTQSSNGRTRVSYENEVNNKNENINKRKILYDSIQLLPDNLKNVVKLLIDSDSVKNIETSNNAYSDFVKYGLKEFIENGATNSALATATANIAQEAKERITLETSINSLLERVLNVIEKRYGKQETDTSSVSDASGGNKETPKTYKEQKDDIHAKYDKDIDDLNHLKTQQEQNLRDAQDELQKVKSADSVIEESISNIQKLNDAQSQIYYMTQSSITRTDDINTLKNDITSNKSKLADAEKALRNKSFKTETTYQNELLELKDKQEKQTLYVEELRNRNSSDINNLKSEVSELMNKKSTLPIFDSNVDENGNRKINEERLVIDKKIREIQSIISQKQKEIYEAEGTLESINVEIKNIDKMFDNGDFIGEEVTESSLKNTISSLRRTIIEQETQLEQLEKNNLEILNGEEQELKRLNQLKETASAQERKGIDAAINKIITEQQNRQEQIKNLQKLISVGEINKTAKIDEISNINEVTQGDLLETKKHELSDIELQLRRNKDLLSSLEEKNKLLLVGENNLIAKYISERDRIINVVKYDYDMQLDSLQQINELYDGYVTKNKINLLQKRADQSNSVTEKRDIESQIQSLKANEDNANFDYKTFVEQVVRYLSYGGSFNDLPQDVTKIFLEYIKITKENANLIKNNAQNAVTYARKQLSDTSIAIQELQNAREEELYEVEVNENYLTRKNYLTREFANKKNGINIGKGMSDEQKLASYMVDYQLSKLSPKMLQVDELSRSRKEKFENLENIRKSTQEYIDYQKSITEAKLELDKLLETRKKISDKDSTEYTVATRAIETQRSAIAALIDDENLIGKNSSVYLDAKREISDIDNQILNIRKETRQDIQYLETFRNEAIQLGLIISQVTGRAILDTSEESIKLFENAWTGIGESYERTKAQIDQIKEANKKALEAEEKRRKDAIKQEEEIYRSKIGNYEITGTEAYEQRKALQQQKWYAGMTPEEIELKDKLYEETMKLYSLYRKNANVTQEEKDQQREIVDALRKQVEESERLELVANRKGTLYARLKPEYLQKESEQLSDASSDLDDKYSNISPTLPATEKTLLQIKDILLNNYKGNIGNSSVNTNNDKKVSALYTNDGKKMFNKKLYNQAAKDMGLWTPARKGKDRGYVKKENRDAVYEEMLRRMSRPEFDKELYNKIINDNGLRDSKTKKVKDGYYNNVLDLMEKEKPGSTGKTEIELEILRKNLKQLNANIKKKSDDISNTTTTTTTIPSENDTKLEEQIVQKPKGLFGKISYAMDNIVRRMFKNTLDTLDAAEAEEKKQAEIFERNKQLYYSIAEKNGWLTEGVSGNKIVDSAHRKEVYLQMEEVSPGSTGKTKEELEEYKKTLGETVVAQKELVSEQSKDTSATVTKQTESVKQETSEIKEQTKAIHENAEEKQKDVQATEEKKTITGNSNQGQNPVLSGTTILSKEGKAGENAGDKIAEGQREAREEIEKTTESITKQGKKFAEYSNEVALGKERRNKTTIAKNAGVIVYDTPMQAHAQTMMYNLAGLDDDLFKDLQNKNFFGSKRNIGNLWTYINEYVDGILQDLQLTREQIKNQFLNILSIDNKDNTGFIPLTKGKEGWLHFSTIDSSGNRTDKVNADDKLNFKVYGEFANILDLTKENIISIMQALKNAGFNGQLKVPGTDLDRIASTDQLVIHGANAYMQKIAYEVLNEQFPHLLKSLKAGFDTKDVYKYGSDGHRLKDNDGNHIKLQEGASFSQIVSSREGSKLADLAYQHLSQETQAAQQAASAERDLAKARREANDASAQSNQIPVLSGGTSPLQEEEQELNEIEKKENEVIETTQKLYRAFNSAHGIMGKGISWFSDDLETAGTYFKQFVFSSGKKDSLAEMMSPDLNKFLTVDAKGADWGEISYNGKTYTANELAEMAKQAGYLGLQIQNVYDSLNGKDAGLQSNIFTIFDSDIVSKAIDNTEQLEIELQKLQQIRDKIFESETTLSGRSPEVWTQAHNDFDEIVQAYKSGSIDISKALSMISDAANNALQSDDKKFNFTNKADDLWKSLKSTSEYKDDIYKNYSSTNWKSIVQDFVDGSKTEKQALQELEAEFRNLLNLESSQPNQIPLLNGVPSGQTSKEIDWSTLPSKYSKEWAESFVNGIQASTPEMEKAYEEFSKAGIETVKTVYDINSPSKVMEQLGFWTGEGFANGIKNSSSSINDALKNALESGKLTQEEYEKYLGLNANTIQELITKVFDINGVSKQDVSAWLETDDVKNAFKKQFNNNIPKALKGYISSNIKNVPIQEENKEEIIRTLDKIRKFAKGYISDHMPDVDIKISDKELTDLATKIRNQWQVAKNSVIEYIEKKKEALSSASGSIPASSSDNTSDNTTTSESKEDKQYIDKKLFDQYTNALIRLNKAEVKIQKGNFTNEVYNERINALERVNELEGKIAEKQALGVEYTEKQNNFLKKIEEQNVNNLLTATSSVVEADLNSLTSQDKYNKYIDDINNLHDKFVLLKDTMGKDILSSNDALLANDRMKSIKKSISEIKSLADNSNIIPTRFTSLDSASSIADVVRNMHGIQKETVQILDGGRKIVGTIRESGKVSRTLEYTWNDILGRFVKTTTVLTSHLTLWERIKITLSKSVNYFKSYFSGYMVAQRIITAVRTGVGYIKELDSALTEMKKVSDQSVSSLKRFQMQSFDTAKSIGTTAAAIQTSAADFMRLGYNLEESSELAKQANIYANVGDMDIQTATEHMISSIKAWESEFASSTQASMSLIDKYNLIGNNYAITSSDIGSAMERSAAALKVAGNSVDEAIGLITAGNLIQQDADTTANALKVMSLRIRGSKSDLSEMGEETDNLASSTSKLREEIKALTGVDLMLDENTYKSTAQIIQEIGAEWDKLTDVSKATTLEKLAGKTRASTVAGLIENYKVIGDVINDSANAEGSALKENAEYMDSIAGRTAQLTTQIQEFWFTLISSDLVKTFITALKDVLELITSITSELGALGTILVSGALFTSLTHGTELIQNGKFVNPFKGFFENMFKTVVSEADMSFLQDFDIGIKDGLDIQQSIERFRTNEVSEKALNLARNAGELGVNLDKITTSSKAAQLGMSALNMALNVGISLVATFAITLGVKMFNMLDDVAKKAKEIGDNFNDAVNSINSYKNEIESLNATISDNKSTTHEVSEARLKLLSIQDEMIKKYGNEEESIKAITAAINGQSDAYDKLIEKQWVEAKNNFEDMDFWETIYYNSFGPLLHGQFSKNDTLLNTMHKREISLDLNAISKGQIHEYQEFFDYMSENGWSWSASNGLLNAEYTKTGNAHDLYEELLKIRTTFSDGMIPPEFLESLRDVSNELKDDIEQYSEYYDQYLIREVILKDENLTKVYSNMISGAKKYQNAIADGNKEVEEQTLQAFGNLFSSLENLENDGKLDSDLLRIFQDMYPALYNESKKWKFKVEFEPVLKKTPLNGMSKSNVLGFLIEEGYQEGETEFEEYRQKLIDNGLILSNDIQEQNKELINLLISWGIIVDDIIETTQDKSPVNPFASEENVKAMQDAQSNINSLSSAMAKLYNGEFTDEDKLKLLQDFPELYDSIDDLEDGINKLINENINKLKTALGEDADPRLLEWIDNLAEKMKDTSVITEWSSSIDKLQESFKTLNEIMTDYNSTGEFTLDQIQTLIDADSDYIQMLDIENGKLVINTNKYKELVGEKLKDVQAILNQALAKEIDALATANNTQEFKTNSEVVAENTLNLSDNTLESIGNAISKRVDEEQINALIDKYQKIYETTVKSFKGNFNKFIGNTSKESGKNAQEEYKKLIDSELSVLDSQFDNGKIDFNKYLNDRLALIENYYNQGKLKAEDYYSLLKDHQQRQLDIMNKVISAVNKKYDDSIDKIDKEIKAIEKENDALNKQLEIQNGVISAINKAIDDEKENLEKEKDAIQEKIDALQESNDEAEKEIELAKAKIALEKAQSQRNKRVYRQGQGFVYEEDAQAVADARENLNKMNRDEELKKSIKALEDEKDAIDEEIKALDEYLKKWNEIQSIRDNALNVEYAKQVLGEDWIQRILSGDEEALNLFSSTYVDTQNKIKTNEDSIEALNKEKDAINELKDAFSKFNSEYEDSINEMYANQILGAGWEKNIFDERSENLDNFAKHYIEVQKSLAQATEDANKAIADAQRKSASDTSTTSSVTSDTPPIAEQPEKVTKEDVDKAYNDYIKAGENLTNAKMQHADEKSVNILKGVIVEKKKIWQEKKKAYQKYAKGGIVGKESSPLDFIAHNLGEDHMVAVKEGEGILTKDQTEKFKQLVKNDGGKFQLKPILTSIDISVNKLVDIAGSIRNNIPTPVSNVVSIGDIIVNGANSPEDVANAIAKRLPGVMLQKLYK